MASTPDPGSAENMPYAVAQNGPNVWAAGSPSGSTARTVALVEHFDGVKWSTVDGSADAYQSSVPFGLSIADGIRLVRSREADARTAA